MGSVGRHGDVPSLPSLKPSFYRCLNPALAAKIATIGVARGPTTGPFCAFYEVRAVQGDGKAVSRRAPCGRPDIAVAAPAGNGSAGPVLARDVVPNAA